MKPAQSVKKVAVVQKPGEEVTSEILASAIVDISKSVKALRAGRLRDRALFLLIKDALPGGSGTTLTDIYDVFKALDDLERQFIRPASKP